VVFIEIMKATSVFGRWIACLLLGWLACCMGLQAAETKLRVELVWGTNDAAPHEKDLKELDAAVRDKLGRTLRWKNYFVVNGLDTTASAKEFRRLELSPRCAVEIRQAGTQLEVRIFQLKAGEEAKLVDTKRHDIEKIRNGELFSFGANSKDNLDDAWLLLVRVAPSAP